MFAPVLSALEEGISVEDLDMHVIYANDAYRRLFGDDVIGMRCFQVYERWSGHGQECPIRASLGEGAPRRAYCEKEVDGRQVTLEIVASPVIGPDGGAVAGVEAVRDVTELVEAHRQVMAKSAEINRLVEVSREISTNLDLKTALRHVVGSAAALVGAEGGTVALLDSERHLITYPYHFNMPEELEGLSVPEGSGLAGEIIRTGQSLILDDYPAHPAHVPEFADAGVQTLLGVPLTIGQRPVGALGLFRKKPTRPFSAEDVDVILAIAEQAAIAIDNARLYSALEERLRIHQELTRAAVSIASGLEIGQVLERVACHAASIVQADAAMIALLDEERNVITYPYSYNLPEELRTVTMPRGRGVAARVIESGEQRLVNDYRNSAFRQPEFEAAGIRAVASVPLVIGERVIGAIGVMDTGSGRRFTWEDMETLSIISRQAAVAVENARLYAELSRAAQQLESRVRERTDALSRMYQESERKSRQLVEANEQLQRASRLKNEFLANVSHELRTPITAVIGFGQLILNGYDGDINDEQRQDLGIVNSNAQELLRLIDDLLDLSRIEAGQVNLFLEEVDPELLVADVVNSLGSQARQKGLKLSSRLGEGVRPVKMDRGKIRQVVANLVSNAIRFTGEGGVTVSLAQDEDETRFQVADTGIGMQPEQAAMIFDRFYQAAPEGEEGMGLGLTISKHLVEMHGGRISVESRPGEGSVFSFTISGGGRQ